MMPDEQRTSLPEPFVHPETDLRNLDGFLLNTERLFASELWALSTGDEMKAALALWCRAWKQVPAGSLPDDERVLAAFSGAGKDWPNVRDMAMRNFEKCSDGRWYHSTLCKEAARAFASQERHRLKREADQDRLRRWREEKREQNSPQNGDGSASETRFETKPETPSKRLEKGKGKGKGKVSESSEEDSSRTSSHELFERWWLDFPRQRRGSKPSAWKNWKRIVASGVDPQSILDGLASYLTSKDVADGYACAGDVWLNKERWNDQPVQAGLPHARTQSQRDRPMDGWLAAIEESAQQDAEYGGSGEAPFALLHPRS